MRILAHTHRMGIRKKYFWEGVDDGETSHQSMAYFLNGMIEYLGEDMRHYA